jgi:hypothetical protein
MYKEVLRAIGGIEIYPVISLLLFVTVFAIVLIRTARLDRRQLDDLSRLPLRDNVTEAGRGLQSAGRRQAQAAVSSSNGAPADRGTEVPRLRLPHDRSDR